MKRIFLLLTTLGVLSASAQHVQKRAQTEPIAPKVMQTDVYEHIGTQVRPTAPTGDRGSAFFSEDFSNGLDGSTAYGAWTVGDNADNSIWHMATATSPDGVYTGSSPALASTTAANGWVIFDPDQYIGANPSWDDPSGSYTTGYLTSPEINMSSLGSAIVEFQQEFIYCCFPLSPLTIDVSVDGQQTWFKFPAQGNFVESANNFSDNPALTMVDISCIAAFQPSVYVRFSYNSDENPGYHQYFWGVDDVKIYENTVTDELRVSEITNGDILGNWEFRVTPFEQRILAADGGLIAGVIYANEGLNMQTGVTMLTEILDATNTVVFSSSTDAFDVPSPSTDTQCPAPKYDTLFVSTGYEPDAPGTYTLRITLAGDQTDATPDNNTLSKTIVFSTDEYGHDDEAAISGYLGTSSVTGTSPLEYEAGGWGNYFSCPNLGSTAYGVTARFGTTTATNVEFKCALIQQDAGVSLTDSDVIAEEYYFMASNWHNGSYKYFPFENSIDLDSNQAYFACIWRENQSPGKLNIGVQDGPDSDLSTGSWELGGSGEYSWFLFNNYTPSVRLIVSERVGIDEVNNTVGLSSFFLSPNPAVSETRINFTLKGSRSVAYEIRDLTGKLIKWHNVGDFAPGSNSFTVDVSSIATGNYVVNLVIDGSTMFSRQLSVQK